jgi:hypothetical protein
MSNVQIAAIQNISFLAFKYANKKFTIAFGGKGVKGKKYMV